MTHISNKQGVISSILDKLIDDAPDNVHESVKARHQQLIELYQSVRRDLENLLNTRVSGLNWPPEWQELNISLIAYGLSDFMSDSLMALPTQTEFCEKLAGIIQRFDPRFKSVQVKLLQAKDKADRTLRMRIEGLLYAEPVPEPIVFDSVLEPETNYFSVTENSYT